MKNKKMSFHQYESKLSSKYSSAKSKSSKAISTNSKQNSKKQATNGQSILPSIQQSSRQPITHAANPALNNKQQNILSMNQRSHHQTSNQQQTYSNISSSIINQFIPNYNQKNDHNQNFTFLSNNNHHHSHTNNHEQYQNDDQNINNNYSQQNQQQINKLDLIFEKQPKQVQFKLRQLLLNYNAVMQYNQDQDKFQVDLLLPFTTIEEKETFVEKFMKSREYVKSQTASAIRQHHYHERRQQQQKYHNTSNSNQHDYKKNQNYNNLNKNTSETQVFLEQDLNNNNIKNKNQSQIQSTSLKQQSKNNFNSEQQKQIINIVKQSNNQVDFYLLGQSLDLSIQRALTKIQQGKYTQARKQEIDENKSQKQQDHHKVAGKQNYSQTVLDQIQQEERHKKLGQQAYSKVNDNNNNLIIQVNNHYNQGPSMQSQIQIQGTKPSVLSYDQEINPIKRFNKTHQTPQKQTSQNQHQHNSPYRPITNQLPSNPANNLNKPSKNSLIYQSPMVQNKNNISNSQIYQKSNASSNQILIEQQQIYLDGDAMEQEEHNNSYRRSKTYDNSYNSHENSIDHNSAFDMIEETAEEHEEEQKHFPSPRQFQEFLKKKLNFAAKNNLVDGKNNNLISPNARNSIKSQQKTNKTITYQNKMLQQYQSSKSSSKGQKAGPSSSIRRKYAQFLNKNHKKIESLYLRIGKQMRLNQKKKRSLQQKLVTQYQSSQFSSSNQPYSSKDQTNQILVLDQQQQQLNKIQKEQMNLASKKQIQMQNQMLEQYKRRIVMENQSMSSQDKVRYFRYLARHAKALYIDYIRNQNGHKKN